VIVGWCRRRQSKPVANKLSQILRIRGFRPTWARVRLAVHIAETLVRRQAAINVAVDHVVNLGVGSLQVPL